MYAQASVAAAIRPTNRLDRGAAWTGQTVKHTGVDLCRGAVTEQALSTLCINTPPAVLRTQDRRPHQGRGAPKAVRHPVTQVSPE